MSEIAFLSFYSGVVDRGVENFVYEISKRLSKKHKLTIFQAGRAIKDPSVRTYHIKSFATKPRSSNNPFSKIYLDVQSLKILLFTLRIFPRLISGKYDVIIPLNGGWQTALCKVAAFFGKSKMLISGHAGVGNDDAFNIFFHPDVFVALTSSESQWARKLTQEVEIVTIPNGVDLAKFHPKVKAKKIELAKPVVVCASALVPYKRVDLTIKAVAKTNMSLLVLGDGQGQGAVDSLGKRMLGARYLRLSVPYDEMPSYYKACQVFTLASKTEAFGISYIEAMACNLPVVTTNDDTRREIIGDAGILTTPEHIDTYAKDLTIAAKTNYRNTPYNQALNFSWNKVGTMYNLLISRLVKN